MDADEKQICVFLKSFSGQFISGREIARRAGGKVRYRQDERWAVPVLIRLVEKKVIESDSTGHFRLLAQEKKDRAKTWTSPQMKKILEQSGKDFSDTLNIEDPSETE
jgi:hypothetical protein